MAAVIESFAIALAASIAASMMARCGATVRFGTGNSPFTMSDDSVVQNYPATVPRNVASVPRVRP
jgi:hypothetical protein